MDNHNNFEKLDIPLVETLIVIYEATHKLIFSLPKFERYSLGEKTEKAVLASIELVIIVNGVSKFEKERILLQVNAKIELLKIFYRIALNCGMVQSRKYLEMESLIQNAGKQTQGWIKYARSTK